MSLRSLREFLLKVLEEPTPASLLFQPLFLLFLLVLGFLVGNWGNLSWAEHAVLGLSLVLLAHVALQHALRVRFEAKGVVLGCLTRIGCPDQLVNLVLELLLEGLDLLHHSSKFNKLTNDWVVFDLAPAGLEQEIEADVGAVAQHDVCIKEDNKMSATISWFR